MVHKVEKEKGGEDAITLGQVAGFYKGMWNTLKPEDKPAGEEIEESDGGH
jgi:hypothetical protein